MNTVLKNIFWFCLLYSSVFIAGNPVVSFTENKGQVYDLNNSSRKDVLFYGADKTFNYFLKQNGLSYQLYNVNSWKYFDADPKSFSMRKMRVADKTDIYRLDISWINCSANSLIKTEGISTGTENFYNEVCPQGVHGVKTYTSVSYKNLYPGIDLKYYHKDDGLKYDYIVNPGADYKQIQLKVEGAQSIAINEKGELVIQTPLGNIVDEAPLVLQNGKSLVAKWKVTNNIVSFDITGIDPKKNFVIDPSVRAWGTYFGGTGVELAYTTSVDASQNIYMTGYEFNSYSLIATTGSYQQTAGSIQDGYISKFDPNGQLIWSTYYGGAANEVIYSSCVSKNKYLYVTGSVTSGSGSVMSTVGTHQPLYAGGGSDAFIAKFDSNGVRVWGTFYGGSGDDFTEGMSCDNFENIYVCGRTNSTAGIATVGAYQTVPATTVITVPFIARFNRSGIRQWGSYYAVGYLYGSACDKFANVYFSGTGAGPNIATPGSYQPSAYPAGSDDCTLIKFDSLGNRIWGTFFGGNNLDMSFDCATDTLGNIYMTGYTSSSVNIATSGAYQTTYKGGPNDMFLAKFSSSCNLLWATYYGDIGQDNGRTCYADKFGNVYMGGEVANNTGTLIASPGCHQYNYGGGSYDGVITCFTSNGTRLWGSYYGDTGYDLVVGCTTNDIGDLYFNGHSNLSTGTTIATPGTYQSTNSGGSSDAFLVKFANPLQTDLNDEIKEAHIFKLYPNPALNEFTVKTEAVKIGSILITDVLGKTVKSIITDKKEVTIDVSDLSQGLYFITINNSSISKLIKN